MKARLIRIIGLFMIFSGLLIYSGCKKDNQNTAPALPPQGSFVMDFSDFSDQASSAIKGNELKSANLLTNYQYAALSVTFWSVILYVNSVIPVMAFKEAFNHQAKYTSNNTWEWTYQLTNSGYNISAKLQGQLITDSVQWKMYLSVTGNSVNITDFLWFSGTSDLKGTGGYWTLYESPASPNALLQINWSKKNENVSSIKYTYVKPGQDGTGNYIEFGTLNSQDAYDRYYNIASVNPNLYIQKIEWNHTSKAGHIKNMGYFSDDLWHCWDSSKIDITCN